MPDSPEITLIGSEVPAACGVLQEFVMGHVEVHDNYLINWIARRRAQNLANRVVATMQESLIGTSAPEEVYGVEFVIDKKRDRNLLSQSLEKVIEDRGERFDQKALLEERQTANWHAQDLALQGLQKALGIKSS